MALIPERDEGFLRGQGFEYELSEFGGNTHLVLKNRELPQAYTPRVADILIILPPGYSMSPLDMWWTSPIVKLTSGAMPLNCEHLQTFGEREWQRWSRHYENWRAGVDDLRSFITAMQKELLEGI